MAAVQRHAWLRAAWACCPSLWALETTVRGADRNFNLPRAVMQLSVASDASGQSLIDAGRLHGGSLLLNGGGCSSGMTTMNC